MKTDVYNDLDSLKRDMRKGRDYRIRTRTRSSKALVMSPHGGFIEMGTSAIANAVAGNDYSFFDFQGLIVEDSFKLHVTSHRFRDPILSRLIERSSFAISVHGMADAKPGSHEIWLGGQNHELKEFVALQLRNEGFTLNSNPPMYRGEHPSNVVNLTANHGVQLELPFSLRKQMFLTDRMFCKTGRCPKTTSVFDRFVRAIRAAIQNYERSR